MGDSLVDTQERTILSAHIFAIAEVRFLGELGTEQWPSDLEAIVL